MKVIIPMSGYGERFRKVGYVVPKPLIQVDKYKMIEHVIKMFSDYDEFIFICNEEHLRNKDWDIENIIKKNCSNFKIISIKPHKLGPVNAILQAKDLVNKEEPLVVNYCDFSCYWNWSHFKEKMKTGKYIGGIPAYKGFHPHSLGSTNYAYLKEKNGLLPLLVHITNTVIELDHSNSLNSPLQ